MSETGTPAPRWARRGPALAAGALAALLLAVFIVSEVRAHQLTARMLRAPAGEVASDPELVRYAAKLARPAYAKRCASCHGKDMQGDQTKGAPSLADSVWLFDQGGVSDLERTILYGIRSGNAKSRNITDMPALGRTLQLSRPEVDDVVAYTLAMGGAGSDPAAVERGSKIFTGKGVCYDCHSSDGLGNPDYGAPNLVDKEWLYGGDRQAVTHSVIDGRHGLCPAWIDKLKPGVIRALAIYIHNRSHPSGEAKP